MWICPAPDGHVQATGRDARGRKQYRYHDDWRTAREVAKFAMLETFGAALPAIRRRRDRDLGDRTVSRDAVAAGVVLLLERTMIRVGNEEYVRANGSYGLTTLRSRHVRIDRDGVSQFRFVGKSGVAHAVQVRDERVAELLQRCRRLPGEHLFQYVNGNGAVHPLTSSDVNAYLRDTAEADVTAKDFRTWMATLMAANALVVLDPPRSAADARRSLNVVIDAVAERLRNTRAVCRASYIHPAVVQTFNDGSLAERWGGVQVVRARGLIPEERRLLGLLRALGPGHTHFARAA